MKFIFSKIADESEHWYSCICNTCGWIGSSADCGTDYGDSGDTDVYCPRCNSPYTDEYEHNRYPFHHPITNLVSRFKAWRIRTCEARYYASFDKAKE